MPASPVALPTWQGLSHFRGGGASDWSPRVGWEWLETPDQEANPILCHPSPDPPFSHRPVAIVVQSNQISHGSQEEGTQACTFPTPSVLHRDIPRPTSAPAPMPFPLSSWYPQPQQIPFIPPSICPSVYFMHSYLLDTALDFKDAKQIRQSPCFYGPPA